MAQCLTIELGGDTTKMIDSRSADVDGANLHYLIDGQGPAIVLLHGYAETSLMWKPIIPQLAERFTVLAPDLPGIGDSSIPADGLDMASAAVRIHALVRSLGVEKAQVVGHDIGLMVAYAYAAQFSSEVEKLVLMDAFLPASTAGRRFTTILAFGISGSMDPLLKRWWKDANGSTLSISGTTSRRTKRVRFLKTPGEYMRRLMLVRDGCAQAGRISCLSKRQLAISRRWRARSSRCRYFPSGAKKPMAMSWASR
jgi:pimeloyl-ACP methyl ester carboxylesterase